MLKTKNFERKHFPFGVAWDFFHFPFFSLLSAELEASQLFRMKMNEWPSKTSNNPPLHHFIPWFVVIHIHTLYFFLIFHFQSWFCFVLLLASLHPLKHSLSAELYHFIHFYDFILQVDLAAGTVNVFFWAYLRADPFCRLLSSCLNFNSNKFYKEMWKKW